ncbi:patatin [Aquabacterium fontiphilum]|uniref:patatin-like phospholipase family protein n=1 Tax=Aquabacterium fontiphilum TaxID=450365 RepID=UPI00137814B2|nr:patatin-like phospholipase family protein [Aquabacterium fontiphilum]NBD20684.1 patatin [Aquabacterium fontiphilum]
MLRSAVLPLLRAACHKVAVGVWVACALSGAAHAAPPLSGPQGDALPDRPRVGLVLSGGGARGLAHVGVLKVLERERIPVDVIAGTSMGAIVGGLYASGLTATQIEAEVRRLDWGNVFASRVDRPDLSQRRKEQDFEVSPLIEVGVGRDGLLAPLGSLSSRVLESHLRRLTLPASHADHFDKLPIPFRAVATDMETGQALVMEQGDLAIALRSSMSVPGIFAPVEVKGRILGDGGLVNNTPVDVARGMGAQRLIVVNVGTPLAPRDTLSTFTGVTAQMINILTEQNVQRSLATLTPGDVLISPQLDGLTAADFTRAVEFVTLGETQAEAMVLRMQDLKVSEAEYARWRSQRMLRLPTPGPLQFVRFEGSKLTHPGARPDILRTQPGQLFDVTRAEKDLVTLAATGDYLRTDYRLVPAPDGGQGLVFDLQDKPWGPDYLQLGMDFSADNRGRSSFNLKLVHTRHWADANGSEWRNFARLGTAPALSTEWWRPLVIQLPDGLSAFLSASAATQRRTLDFHDDPDGARAAQVRRQGSEIALDGGLNWRELGEWRLGWVRQWHRDDPELVSDAFVRSRGGEGLDVQRWREQGWRLRAVFDQLDHAFFPLSGWRIEGQWFQGELARRGGSDIDSGDTRALQLQAQAVHTWGLHTWSLHGRLALSDGAQPEVPRFGLGGFQQLSGYAPFQISGPQVGVVRLGYRIRLTDMSLTRGTYFGSSLEAGNAWDRFEDVGKGRLRWGGSLYLGADTAIGPVYGAVGYSPVRGATLMLFVGRP